MKAMLLAAGKGERMRPLTLTTPKPLLQVGGKSLIEYHLENLRAAGIEEVVINHAWLGEKIEHALGDGSSYGLKILYSAEGEALETAGGIKKALPLLGNSPFLVISADVWTDYDFSSLSKVSLKEDLAYLVMVENAPHHPRGDFSLQEGRLGLLHETNPSQTCTYSGFGLYSPDLFDNVDQGVQALRPYLDQAAHSHQLRAELYQGKWLDVGTPERLLDLEATIKLNA